MMIGKQLGWGTLGLTQLLHSEDNRFVVNTCTSGSGATNIGEIKLLGYSVTDSLGTDIGNLKLNANPNCKQEILLT